MKEKTESRPRLTRDELALIPRPKTFFMKVTCEKCGNQQTIFSAANRTVKCMACDHLLAEPSASRIKLKVKKYARL